MKNIRQNLDKWQAEQKIKQKEVYSKMMDSSKSEKVEKVEKVEKAEKISESHLAADLSEIDNSACKDNSQQTKSSGMTKWLIAAGVIALGAAVLFKK